MSRTERQIAATDLNNLEQIKRPQNMIRGLVCLSVYFRCFLRPSEFSITHSPLVSPDYSNDSEFILYGGY